MRFTDTSTWKSFSVHKTWSLDYQFMSEMSTQHALDYSLRPPPLRYATYSDGYGHRWHTSIMQHYDTRHPMIPITIAQLQQYQSSTKTKGDQQRTPPPPEEYRIIQKGYQMQKDQILRFKKMGRMPTFRWRTDPIWIGISLQLGIWHYIHHHHHHDARSNMRYLSHSFNTDH